MPRVIAAQLGHRLADHADLRPVPVRNDALVARFNQVGDGRRRRPGRFHLFGQRFAERVTA
jgi:hypothetical protein